MNETGLDASCKLCGTCATKVKLHCSFCGKITVIPVNYREASSSGRTTIVQMSVHKTVIFN